MDPHSSSSADDMDTDEASTSREMEDRGAEASLGHGRDQALAPAPGDAWSLLSVTRRLIDEGKPSLALQMMLEAKRAQGGEGAVLQTLQRARELYMNKLQANSAADELASLFAECAIAESQPEIPNQQQAPLSPVLQDNANDNSILTMSGRKQIMLDAFSDGSSFICLKCGGLVSKFRKDEHLAYWCGKY